MNPTTIPAGTLPDLSKPETFSHEVPHGAFDIIRDMTGLYWQPAQFGTPTGGFWAVTRFDDILEFEKRPDLFSSSEGPGFPLLGSGPNNEFADNLMFMDPPKHGRVRRAAAASFGPRVVANFDGWIREIVEEVLDDTLPLGTFDYVEHVAKLIPSRVVARVLGVPFERRGDIVRWTDAIFHASAFPDSGAIIRKQSADEVFPYIRQLQQQKLRAPEDDMVTVLAQYVERGEISQEEYQYYVSLLMVAGYETTHTLIGQSMRMILEDPAVAEQTWRDVAAGESTRVVDEFLRFITPAMNMARVATQDVEFLGQQIRQGDVIQLYFIAANRDPDVYTNPHLFNPQRTETKTLAFGSGAHRCIGNSLAKLEVRILLEELHKRAVKLELNGSPQRGHSTWINQLFKLPVKVG
jgi:cytochrome P450